MGECFIYLLNLRWNAGINVLIKCIFRQDHQRGKRVVCPAPTSGFMKRTISLPSTISNVRIFYGKHSINTGSDEPAAHPTPTAPRQAGPGEEARQPAAHRHRRQAHPLPDGGVGSVLVRLLLHGWVRHSQFSSCECWPWPVR